MPDDDSRRAGISEEFTRAAAGFAERTAGRFDGMDVVGFSRVAPGDTVVEVGAGTGNFLSLFEDVSSRCVALDLTSAMLAQARERYPRLHLVKADAVRLPLASSSVELVTTAQMLHHVWRPVPVLMEMRRVAAGRVLIVDQHAPESYEQQAFMNQLEAIRDPTHAVSRPPSAFRVMVQAAGLRIVDERSWEGESSLSRWMWPGEFPGERIAEVKDFIERFGAETGMEWRRSGDDWVFTRRRLMLLAEPT